MQKLTFVVLLTLVVLFNVANANDHHTKHHKHEHEHEHVGKTPKFSLIQNIKYPTLASVTSGLTPRVLTQDSTCNIGSVAVTKTISYTETTGEDRCWSLQSSLGSNATVSAGAPEITQTSSGYKWTVGSTRNYKLCTHATRTVSTTLTVTVPPRTSCKLRVSQFASPITGISWTGSARTVFTDGSSSTSSTSGSYSGIFLTRAITTRNCVPVTTCASNDDVNGDDDDDDDDDSSSSSSSSTTTGDDDDDDDEEADSVSFELPPNEPKTELLQNTPVGDVATA